MIPAWFSGSLKVEPIETSLEKAGSDIVSEFEDREFYMKATTRILMAAGLVFLLAGCNGKFSAVAPLANSPVAPAVVYSPSVADNHLTADVYNCNKSDVDNVFFSPFSIITALAMASEGAKGNTQLEMQKVLYLNSDDTIRRTGFQSLIAEINKPGKGYQLSTSNHLWLEQTFTPLSTFVNPVVQYYSAGVTSLDFINNPGGSAQTINDTVSNETAGKITNLLSPSDLPPTTKFVLTNAIYFKADWQRQFEASSSFPRAFFLNNGSTALPTMMNQTMPGAIEDYYGKAQVLELPYVNRDVSMFIFLPPTGQMAGLEADMTGPQLDGWFAARVAPSLGVTQVAVTLPKFKFSTHYDLGNILKSLGMVSAFSSTMADFSGIDGLKDLYISKVVHQAFVAVDEKGTEAAAATGVIGVGMVSYTPMPPTVPFTVDHPFFFALYENNARAVLFLGKVNDPTK